MIYAYVKGISLNEDNNIVFIVDRIDSDKVTSGTVQYPVSVGDLKFPRLIRLKLQKAISEEINSNFSKNYSSNDVFFISFANDSNLDDWQPVDTFIVDEYDSSFRLDKRIWYRSFAAGIYSGKICEEINSWTGSKLIQKETKYYDDDGATVIESWIETFFTSNSGKTKIQKKVYS